MKSEKTNEELLSAYQNGSFDAFDGFYKRNSKLILNFLIFRLRSTEDAEEVLQEVFIRVHKSILKYDPARPALSWVFTIAKNLMIDKIRARRSDNVELNEIASTEPNIDFLTEIREELENLLGKCSGEEATLLKSRFVEGHSYEELSRQESLGVDNLRQKVFRILKKVRNLG